MGRRFGWFAGVAAVVGLASAGACGGGGGGNSGTGAGTGATSTGGTGTGTTGSETSSTTTTTSTSTGTGGGGPQGGALGAACQKNGDCDSGVCMTNGHCTAPCSTKSDCPAGPSWDCAPMPGHGSQCQCNSAGAETCDGFDNDCNTVPDDGATCSDWGTSCQQGQCVCLPENQCGAACVDKQQDASNCGACGHACASGATCRAGACVGFAPPVAYAVSPWMRAIAAGDLDGDGHLDLVVPDNTLGWETWVLRGKGDGTFLAGVKYLAGQADSVVMGDFDGNSTLDVVLAGEDAYGVMYIDVLPGAGDGTLLSAVRQLPEGHVDAVAAGDFNADGKLDLFGVNTYTLPNGSAAGRVCVFLGYGDGTFQTQINHDAPIARSPAVADLDGDGKLDAVVADGNANTVMVFLGNGDGTLQNQVDYGVAAKPASVAIADLNGDAKPDLVVAAESGVVSVLLGNGDGTFKGKVDYSAEWQGRLPWAIAVRDFNGDKKPDLAVLDRGAQNGGSVTVLLGHGDGTFQDKIGFDVGAGFNFMALAVGDFNGDGKADLAVGRPGNVYVLLNVSE